MQLNSFIVNKMIYFPFIANHLRGISKIYNIYALLVIF